MARGEFPIQFACFFEAEEASWPNEMLLNKGWVGQLGKSSGNKGQISQLGLSGPSDLWSEGKPQSEGEVLVLSCPYLSEAPEAQPWGGILGLSSRFPEESATSQQPVVHGQENSLNRIPRVKEFLNWPHELRQASSFWAVSLWHRDNFSVFLASVLPWPTWRSGRGEQ